MHAESDPDQAAAPEQAPAGIVEPIDEAVAATEALDTIPLAEHAALFDAVHAALNEALSSIDVD